MKNLPNWILTNPFPTFYDAESGTVIQQTGKVYAAMQELINEHNQFIIDIQNQINKIDEGNTEFKQCLTKIVEDYIKTIDEKIKLQDQKIESAISKVSDESIKGAIEQGKIVATPIYEEGTENLSIGISYKE